MDLQILWFVIVAFFWSATSCSRASTSASACCCRSCRGRARARRDVRVDRPVWDGNEVWLVVAGAATFAAFPAWYATMFSGFYIALLLVLFFLIIRVVSFEWREKSTSPRWRAVWLWANAVGSYGAALIWGVGLANLLYGVPLDSNGDFTGTFWDLFSPYTVLAGSRSSRCSPSTAPPSSRCRTTGRSSSVQPRRRVRSRSRPSCSARLPR
jgi:cytochrome d ubiquinol oxidase subunit II